LHFIFKGNDSASYDEGEAADDEGVEESPAEEPEADYDNVL
jgi:hypothetical protein